MFSWDSVVCQRITRVTAALLSCLKLLAIAQANAQQMQQPVL